MASSKQISTIALLSILVLTGCNDSNKVNNIDTNTTQKALPVSVVKTSEADGIKTQEVSYKTPAGNDSMKVSVTLKKGIVMDVSVTPLAVNPISLKIQKEFSSGVAKSAVGKNIGGLKVDTVSGASLSTGAFNEFLANNAQ
jgi:major membrane immunogen (membrane-anchored lipoprotein)